MGRSRKHRQRFDCGHRGFGRYCHRCADAEMGRRRKAEGRRESRERRAQGRVIDGVNLAKLPKKVVQKAKEILGWLRQGVHPGAIGGRQFPFDRDWLRIPVGYRYRLLCWRGEEGIKPLKVMSHEAYNPVMRNTHR